MIKETSPVQIEKLLLRKYKSKLAKEGKKMKHELESFIRSELSTNK